MDMESQVMLALVSLLAAVVHLNSVFCNVMAAYMRRRQAIIRVDKQLQSIFSKFFPKTFLFVFTILMFSISY